MKADIRLSGAPEPEPHDLSGYIDAGVVSRRRQCIEGKPLELWLTLEADAGASRSLVFLFLLVLGGWYNGRGLSNMKKSGVGIWREQLTNL